ncbi:alpha/beta fold hydrolase [Gordonia sp. KTR9]|uniref:alpha/beta fold hydrolase n=1 Tax=Gordonia sp. KTR9 TaxID=337191 RepID=UPI0005CA4322|nr:alpha/beta hydrolase [Gordonia sp. KTR9]
MPPSALAATDPPVDEPTPVVLVHGIRVSGATLHRVAAAVAATAPAGRDVVTPDLPGHGRRRAERFTMDAAVDAVVAEIERFGRPAVVAGMSMGGYVAMAAASRHPHHVAALVPMCATAQPSRILAAPFETFGAVTSLLPRQAAVISQALTRLAVGRQVSEDMEIGGLSLGSIADVVAELKHFDALGEVGRYPGRTVFVNGRQDQFRVHERRFVEAAADATLTIVPRASHLFPLIQPELAGRLVGEVAAGCDHAGALGHELDS